MKFKLFMVASVALTMAAGCKSIEKSSDGASMRAAESPSMAEQIALHQSVITKAPSEFSQQVRANDLEGARKTAETMYRTLEALESSRPLASQVCFGGSEIACSTFRKYMSQDIKSLYDGFVVSNSLSTGELLKIATKIETSAALQYR
jgi:hypothetical protein